MKVRIILKNKGSAREPNLPGLKPQQRRQLAIRILILHRRRLDQQI